VQNNTKTEEHKIELKDLALENAQLFVLNIHFKGRDEFQLHLNCEALNSTNYKFAVPLSIDNIYVFLLIFFKLHFLLFTD
jgi:hypothetical protein